MIVTPRTPSVSSLSPAASAHHSDVCSGQQSTVPLQECSWKTSCAICGQCLSFLGPSRGPENSPPDHERSDGGPSHPTCYGDCPARAVQDEALSPRHVACDPRLPSSRSSSLYQVLTLFSQVLSKASDLLDCLMFAGTCGGNRLSTIAAPSPLFFLSDSAHSLCKMVRRGPSFLPPAWWAGKRNKMNKPGAFKNLEATKKLLADRKMLNPPG